MKARHRILLTVIVVAAVAVVWAVTRFTSGRTIPTAVAERGEFEVSILRSGEVKARRSVTVSAPTVGEKLVITRLIPEGTFVEEGDLLVEFDTTELLERLRTQSASLLPILSLPDLSTLYVATDVDEIDISRVEEGQICLVTPEAYPDNVFPGIVGNVGNLARTKYYGSGPNVFDVQVDLDEIDPRFRPGMNAKVELIIDTFEDEIFVPIEAVFSQGGETVVCLRNGGAFDKRPVVVGTRNDTHIIVHGGLEASQEIALVNPLEKREE